MSAFELILYVAYGMFTLCAIRVAYVRGQDSGRVAAVKAVTMGDLQMVGAFRLDCQVYRHAPGDAGYLMHNRDALLCKNAAESSAISGVEEGPCAVSIVVYQEMSFAEAVALNKPEAAR